MHNDEQNNGRDRQGRFARGSAPAGPGRRRGPCKRTKLRDAMLASLERYPKGFKGFLDELRDNQPIEFLKVYAKLQPREAHATVESKRLVLNIVEVSPDRMAANALAYQSGTTCRDMPQLPVDGDE